MPLTSLVRRRSTHDVVRPLRLRVGVFAAITILAVSNVVSNRLWPQAYLPWNVAVAASLMVLALACGLSWADLGLTRRWLRRGLTVGGGVAGGVAALYALAFAVPATRGMFADDRAAGPLAAALFAAFVRIPLGTVLPEELAFRGVLPGLIGGSWWRRTLVSSGLFGLWHVLPALGMAKANTGIGTAIGRWGAAGQTVATVLATSGAGVLLSIYRRWGGHLVAPMLVHVATNSLGTLLAWATFARRRGDHATTRGGAIPTTDSENDRMVAAGAGPVASAP